MRANDVRSTDAIRHGAYVCLAVPADALGTVANAAVPALADRLGLRNEFEPGNGDPPQAIAYLRRITATSSANGEPIPADAHLLRAQAVLHVAAATPEPVSEFCAELARLLEAETKPLVLRGVARPLIFTGDAMFNYSYAHRVLQQPGSVMPNAFLVPMRKSDAWWGKDWMERHTYFLPRYDESGHMASKGHTLAAAAGIDCIMRRTYKSATEPAPEGEYDFVSYFECADEDVPTFRQVCDALRDVTNNPEWRYVREGPTWHGRRVAAWPDLFR